MKTVYRKTNPHLFDVAIDEIQTALDNECSWLNTIFGRCERLVKEINGNKYYTANWHKQGNDYVLVAPDEGLGNFCFFTLEEPTNLDTYFAGDVTRCNVGFSLILWCDLRTINTNRNTESIKEEILQILNERTHLHSGRLSINKVYERAENVFREFDYNELDNQYNMHPFAAFRFEGELMVDTLCDAYIPPTPPVEPKYIRGHLTTGANLITFRINNQNVTTNVGADGWWKWDVEEEITSFANAFYDYNTEVLDFVEIVGVDLSTITALSYAFGQGGSVANKYRILDMSKCKGSIQATPNYFLYRNRTIWYMPNIDKWATSAIVLQGACRIIAKGYIKTNLYIQNTNALTEGDVLSLIEAAAADVTYFLQTATYNNCSESGAWYYSVKAAIDAKAAQGFTVTLISA